MTALSDRLASAFCLATGGRAVERLRLAIRENGAALLEDRGPVCRHADHHQSMLATLGRESHALLNKCCDPCVASVQWARLPVAVHQHTATLLRWGVGHDYECRLTAPKPAGENRMPADELRTKCQVKRR